MAKDNPSELIRAKDLGAFDRWALPSFDPEGAENLQRKLGAGYKLPLSKRTNLYADIGHGREDGKTNNTAYGFGIKHLF
jgi:predicted porin